MIETLVEKGHAYASDDGSVYFKISSFPGYGKLSRLDERELDLGKTQNARANSDEYEKDSLSDFVLWKAPQAGGWRKLLAVALGRGPPRLAPRVLGDDPGIPRRLPSTSTPAAWIWFSRTTKTRSPRAQCACGGHFAAHWFHITHLLVDGGKMSKSLGNLYTLEDLAAKGFTAMEVRYVLIGAHYRKPLNFTLDSLAARPRGAGKAGERRARQLAAKVAGRRPLRRGRFRPVPSRVGQPQRRPQHPRLPRRPVHRPARGREAQGEEAAAALAGFNRVLRALGLALPEEEPEAVEIPADIRALAEDRWAARLAKNWAESDTLRARARRTRLAHEGRQGRIHAGDGQCEGIGGRGLGSSVKSRSPPAGFCADLSGWKN